MDLFHATGLKNHKASFDATYNAIEFSINQIKNSYNEKWNELNEVRKKWAAIQEKIIFIVKSNGLKFSKSLDKCTNEEMIAEIERLAALIPEECMVLKKYEDGLILYYKKILSLAEELETLSKKINLMNPQEIDKDEELIIDLDDYRKKRNQTNNSMEVISVYPATEDIIKSKNKLFKKNEVEEVPFIEVNYLLVTGSVVEKTYRPTEKFENAYIERKDMQYSYSDGDLYYFMDQETFDMIPIGKDQVGDAMKFVKENDVCKILSYKGNVFDIEPPTFVELAITETEPGFAGNTATGATKPATLETGAVIQVPLFVDGSDIIRVDTRTGEYMERVNK